MSDSDEDSGGNGGGSEGNGGSSSYGGGPSRGTPSPPGGGDHEKTTPRTATIFTTRNTKEEDTTAEPTIEPTTITTTTRKPFHRTPLVCERKLYGWVIIPPEHLCDHLLLTSTSLTDNLINATIWAFEIFKLLLNITRSVASTTRLAMSLVENSWTPRNYLNIVHTPAMASRLQRLHDVNVYDWAFSNGDGRAYSNMSMLAARIQLDFLKELHSVQKQMTQTTLYKFWTAYFPSALYRDEVVNLLKSTFTPHFIIITVQQFNLRASYVNYSGVLVPLNNYVDPKKRGAIYGHPLVFGLESAQYLDNNEINATFLLSIAYGAWKCKTKKQATTSVIMFQDMSVDSCVLDYASPYRICHTGKIDIMGCDEVYHSCFFSQEKNAIYTFDNKNTLQYKVCNTWNDASTLDYGLALYSVIGDDTIRRGCQKVELPEKIYRGNWVNLKFLRDFNEFLNVEKNTTDGRPPGFLDRCMQIP
ncbi:uncharacterized protein LOC144135085 [Amblyomma americanum]